MARNQIILAVYEWQSSHSQGKDSTNMKKITCAWCEKEKGIKTSGSHGICKRHKKEFEKQLKRLRKEKGK